MFQSETYGVIDGTFYDKGILNDPQTNDNWSNLNNNMSVNRTSQYTTIQSTVGSSQNRWIAPTVTETAFVIEFDKHSTTVVNQYFLINGTGIQLHLNNIPNANHLKFIVSNGNIKIYCDGEYKTTVTYSSHTGSVLFQFNSSGLRLDYSNFVIYPI